MRTVQQDPDAIHIKDSVGRTALHWSISGKKLEAFNILVQNGPESTMMIILKKGDSSRSRTQHLRLLSLNF